MMKRAWIWTLCISMVFVPSALAGRWVSPNWPGGAEPRFDNVPLYWFEVVDAPVLYRAVVEVPDEANRVTVGLRTLGYVYVYVNGQKVYQWQPRPRTREDAGDPADADRVHWIDLTEAMVPGENVLVVSAPAGSGEQGGFALDGGVYAGAERLAELATGPGWTATKFRPTTIVEDHAIMTADYTGQAEQGLCSAAAPIRAVGQPWQASEDALARAHWQATLDAVADRLDQVQWRLELLTESGIYIVDNTAYGWAGPNRPNLRAPMHEVQQLPARLEELRSRLEGLQARTVETEAQLATQHEPLQAARRAGRDLYGEVETLSRDCLAADRFSADALAQRAFEASGQGPTDHPLNELNESRYDRLGWMNLPQLTDSDIGRWGVRVNPVTGPTEVRFSHRWRFRTDPQNVGINEQRHTIGYNIENQWPRIDGQQSWTNNENFRDYAGTAWYRQAIFIPAEWAGNEVVLHIRSAGDTRIWLNDTEITEYRQDGHRYVAPPGLLMYGADNYVAVRVEAREGRTRGLHGVSTASCPALEGPGGRQTPPVDLLASPLSPCVVMMPRTDRLEIHHAGQAEVTTGGDGGWALLKLMPVTEAGMERPILLVFQQAPRQIDAREGVTEITLAATGSRVVAVRPWAEAIPTEAQLADEALLGRWRRLAQLVPVDYMNVTRVVRAGEPWQGASIDDVPAGPMIENTVVYDYFHLDDQWNTEPLRIAPLPALCVMAIEQDFRGLEVDDLDAIETLQDGGLAGPYRALADAQMVTYRYPIEAWPRFAGFTSWMFGGTDTGVPGNVREMELIAATGANSYRPQHNWSDQLPPEWMRQGDKTRVEIMWEACNDVGVNYMNNIDQTLGPYHEMVRQDYDRWVEEVLYPHYERLVPQLADKEFWEVAYDLINEPFDHQAVAYNPVMRELTRQIRQVDRTHLMYIEPCQAWGAIQQLRLIEPTGDPLTMYSFHDYNFRLREADDRWPTTDRDMRNIRQMWWPAFEFAIQHGTGMHCGEFGGFGGASNDSPAQILLLNDLFRIFDQFGMHHHYYSGRGIFERNADGSMGLTNVVRAYRAYFAREDFNYYYEEWPERPSRQQP